MHLPAVISNLTLAILLVLPVVFCGIFIGFWCLVCLLISATSRWGRLARQYRTEARPDGEVFSLASATLNGARYKNCLTIGLSTEGLYLAPFFIFRAGHPPLLIPWSAVGPMVSHDHWGTPLYSYPIKSGHGETVPLSFWDARVVQAIANHRLTSANRAVELV